MPDPLATLAALLSARRPAGRRLGDEQEEEEGSGDPIADRLKEQGWTRDQIRAFYIWLSQRGFGRRPGPDFSPFPNPGESDVPRKWPEEESMYPNPVYPPGYEERGRLLLVPPPDAIPKDWTRWM